MTDAPLLFGAIARVAVAIKDGSMRDVLAPDFPGLPLVTYADVVSAEIEVETTAEDAPSSIFVVPGCDGYFYARALRYGSRVKRESTGIVFLEEPREVRGWRACRRVEWMRGLRLLLTETKWERALVASIRVGVACAGIWTGDRAITAQVAALLDAEASAQGAICRDRPRENVSAVVSRSAAIQAHARRLLVERAENDARMRETCRLAAIRQGERRRARSA